MSRSPPQIALERVERALTEVSTEESATGLLAEVKAELDALCAEPALEPQARELTAALGALAAESGTAFAKARTQAIELLFAIQAQLSPAEAPSNEEEIELDPATLAIVWPIFAREAHAQVRTLRDGGATLPAEEALTALHSLKGSAASLGFQQIARLARALEHSAEQRWPPVRPEAFSAALLAIESALQRGDAGEAPQVDALSAILSAL